MTPRERVRAALSHTQPDYTPCDYYATPEIHAALLLHFGLGTPRQVSGTLGGSAGSLEDGGLAERLGTDIHYVNPPYIGPPLASFNDGSSMNLWGVRRRPMTNEYGEYAEPVGVPYAAWKSVEEAEKFPWPSPDWFDYSDLPARFEKYPDVAIAVGGSHVQDFINGVAFGRGVEQVLLDVASDDPVYLYIVEQRHRFYMAYIERILDAVRGRIDLVHCGDDFGSQRGPLISPASFDRLFAANGSQRLATTRFTTISFLGRFRYNSTPFRVITRQAVCKFPAGAYRPHSWVYVLGDGGFIAVYCTPAATLLGPGGPGIRLPHAEKCRRRADRW